MTTAERGAAEPEDDRRQSGADERAAGESTDHRAAEGRGVSAAGVAVAAAGPRAAAKFVGRLSQLGVAEIRAAIHAWQAAMRAQSEPWFAAERTASRAVLVSSRSTVQEVLLGHVADSIRRLWYRGARGSPPATPEEHVGATEASGQYVASVAMLAVLVRDRITAAEFALLYQPFATLIPSDELARE